MFRTFPLFKRTQLSTDTFGSEEVRLNFLEFIFSNNAFMHEMLHFEPLSLCALKLVDLLSQLLDLTNFKSALCLQILNQTLPCVYGNYVFTHVRAQSRGCNCELYHILLSRTYGFWISVSVFLGLVEDAADKAELCITFQIRNLQILCKHTFSVGNPRLSLTLYSLLVSTKSLDNFYEILDTQLSRCAFYIF